MKYLIGFLVAVAAVLSPVAMASNTHGISALNFSGTALQRGGLTEGVTPYKWPTMRGTMTDLMKKQDQSAVRPEGIVIIVIDDDPPFRWPFKCDPRICDPAPPMPLFLKK